VPFGTGAAPTTRSSGKMFLADNVGNRGHRTRTIANPSVKYVTSFSAHFSVLLNCVRLLCYVFDALVSSRLARMLFEHLSPETDIGA
jgi:hypothetical protein